MTDEVLFGDVWAPLGLPPRDRSLIRVAALTAVGRTHQLRSHLGHKAVFENDRVRVLEYVDEPGQHTKPHRHPDSEM